MTRRTDRIGSLIREIIGETIHSKISDPRIKPALTSITRVEVGEDLLTAKVFVSVLDDEAALRNTIRALDHAAGRFQETMMQKMRLRVTPMLSFHADKTLRKTIKTLELIQQAMDEIDQKTTATDADTDTETITDSDE